MGYATLVHSACSILSSQWKMSAISWCIPRHSIYLCMETGTMKYAHHMSKPFFSIEQFWCSPRHFDDTYCGGCGWFMHYATRFLEKLWTCQYVPDVAGFDTMTTMPSKWNMLTTELHSFHQVISLKESLITVSICVVASIKDSLFILLFIYYSV